MLRILIALLLLLAWHPTRTALDWAAHTALTVLGLLFQAGTYLTAHPALLAALAIAWAATATRRYLHHRLAAATA